MEIRDKIKPFAIVEYDGGASLCLYSVGEYKQEIFETRLEDGFTGNGYDWTALAKLFIEEEMPDISDDIDFDPEAGMFTAFADDAIILEAFAAKFKSALDDDEFIYEFIKRVVSE